MLESIEVIKKMKEVLVTEKEMVFLTDHNFSFLVWNFSSAQYLNKVENL